MTVTRFNPFNEMLNLQREMNRLFESFAPARRDGGYDSAVWRPMVDVHEDENHYHIEVELPGLSREDVKLSYQDGTLSISGERRYRYESEPADGEQTTLSESTDPNGSDSSDNGTDTAVATRPRTSVQRGGGRGMNVHRVERFYGRFHRSFSFPTAIDADSIRAQFTDGVLNVTVPKAEEVKPRQIEIG